MSNINKDLGMATAYAYAVSQGYEGTEEEFAALMASYASVAQEAGEARDEAEAARDTAVNAVEGFEDTVITATDTAVQAVQDKGDEVIESIPADYTQLDQDVTDLKSDFSNVETAFSHATGNTILQNWSENHKYINILTNPVNIDTPVTTSSNVRYLICECSDGDVFHLTTKGGNTSRAYAFLTSEKRWITYADANKTYTDITLTAPANSAYFVVNDESLTGFVVRGTWLYDKLDQEAYLYRGLLKNTDDLNDVTDIGLYNIYSASIPANVPRKEGGLLSVESYDTFVKQEYSTGGKFYQRFKNSLGWSDWLKLSTITDIRRHKSIVENLTGNEVIEFSDPELHQYINTNPLNIQWDTPSVASTPVKWAVVECKKGDHFIINGQGGVNDQLWVFTDANKRALQKSGTNIHAENLLLTAPTNAKYLVINDESDSFSYIGYNSPYSKRDIPKNQGVRNAYKKAHQLLDITWEQLSDIPSASGTTIQAGTKEGIVYSSVKEYDKYVGFNVSLKTFMTAANNPYSLLYTEDEYNNTSGYGIDYVGHGINVGAYFGIVCNTFIMYALGSKIPWNTAEFEYLSTIGVFDKLYDQTGADIELMDVIWEPGHGNIILDIFRDERGNPKYIFWAEAIHNFPVVRYYTYEQFVTRLQTNSGIIYRYRDLYKNLDYTPSEFVAVEDETEPQAYVYNDDICTYAGDYACFNSGDDVYINYTAGSYTKIEVYKNNSYLNEISINSSEHSKKITTDGYGMYKARLSDSINNSDWTYFEIVDTNVSASYSDNILSVDFSSENGTPIYAQLTYRTGVSRGIIELTEEDINAGHIEVDPYNILNAQYPNGAFDESTYVKVFFEGQYGTVPNPYGTPWIVI